MVAVLIVDDHKHLVESLLSCVPWEEAGVTGVHGAYSGGEALETLRSKNIGILVTDIRMPGMSGLELIERARADRPELQCILLTGHAEFEYARRAIELQTFRYLMKPVRTNELVETVRLLTASSRAPAAEAAAAEPAAPEPPAELPAEPAEAKDYRRKTVEAVHEFVRERLGADVTLTAIAERVHLHPVYLSKLYKETTGTKLSDYILNVRIDKAKELLLRSPMKIYEISEAVGYRSTQHFITEFKKIVGMTPKAYQSLHR